MPSRPKRGSGERSNWYSGSKYTNWTPFDPYWSEAKAARTDVRPKCKVERIAEEPPLPIFATPPHDEFIQPCTPDSVARTLREVPSEFLQGLTNVFLLSGTKKQSRASRLFRYGCYAGGDIYLHAYPKNLLKMYLRGDLKPSVEREYIRAGASIGREGANSVITFEESSLKRFYLYDVLLHEVGHHVDKRVNTRPSRDAERFAEWFAEAEAKNLFDEPL